MYLNIRGRLSYTESYDANANLVIRTSYSYDEMGRVELMVESGPTAYSKQMNYSYDLQGDVTSKTYNDSAPGMMELFGSFSWDYSYDEAGRLNSVGTEDAMSGIYTEGNFQYFASGKLQQLVLGYEDPTVATVNYHYNQRGWLTSDSSTDFWEHLGYDQPAIGSQPEYNGNISSVTYNMNGDAFTPSSEDLQDFPPSFQPAPTTTVGYAFTYDNANRLTWANFEFELQGLWGEAVSYGQNTEYDDNGNMKTLSRYENNATLVDNLSYNYRPGTDIDTLITNSAGAVQFTHMIPTAT